MPWVAPLIMAGGAIAGGMIGNSKAAADRDAQMGAYSQSVRDLEAIGIPSEEAQRLTLERYRSAGQLTPELEQAIQQGDSQMGGISTDPTTHEAQLAALNKLREVGTSGGMTLADRANMENTMGGIAADERGRREAGLSRMRSRGQLGSGLELAAQMGGDQQDITARHMAGITAAGSAQARALEAIKAGGQLGGQMRDQEFGEKERVAKAQDQIAQWNAANTQDARTRNTNRMNTANEYNLNSNQRIADANTDLGNKEQIHNRGLGQQTFQNRLAIGTAKANARAGQATALGQSAQRTADMWAGIGSGVGKAGATYANSQSSAPATTDDEYNKSRSQLNNWKYGG